MMRAAVRCDDILGLSQSYDQPRTKASKEELEVVGRFLRSGQHAYRNHRESVAAIVVTLFNDQTPPADVEMMYIKETVFGVRDGAPLMDRSHPCLAALAAAYTGACDCV